MKPQGLGFDNSLDHVILSCVLPKNLIEFRTCHLMCSQKLTKCMFFANKKTVLSFVCEKNICLKKAMCSVFLNRSF